jgi:hypothetical protein
VLGEELRVLEQQRVEQSSELTEWGVNGGAAAAQGLACEDGGERFYRRPKRVKAVAWAPS